MADHSTDHTAACTHEEVEGYIQPSIDPQQLLYDPIERVYTVHWELFNGKNPYTIV
jgi:hypothetical protein